MDKINIIIIGAGMYVCGKGTRDFGTIMPALCEFARAKKKRIGQVHICCTNPQSASEAEQRINELFKQSGISFPFFMHPQKGYQDAYFSVLAQIPQPACAIVAVPDHLHGEIGSCCLEAGLHTLIVKPLTVTVQEATNLIFLQKQYNLYGAVEFHKRFDKDNLKLKEIIQSRRLGTLLYFIVEYSQRKSIPSKVFRKWVDKTNVFQYLGVHYVDIIHFVTRAMPKKVMAIGQYGCLKANGIETYDAVHATIEWEGMDGKPFCSFILTNWIDPESTSAMSDQKIKVIGTNGRYESDQKRRGINIVTDIDGIEEPNPYFCSTFPGELGDLVYQGYGIECINTFLYDVINLSKNQVSIEQLESIRPTFQESLISTAVIEAVNLSLGKNGRWVDVINIKENN